MRIVAFVPVRLNSKRLTGKNLKMLAGKPLMYYVPETLSQVKTIDEIYVFCSSEEVKSYLPEGVKFLKRSEHLDRDETLGGEIYDAFVNAIDADLYILAHTTSPFIKASTIENAIKKIKHEKYDSALSVEKIQTFAWYDGKPLNYALNHVPRTQDLNPVLVETSAFFMFKKEVWKTKKQRIGDNPYFSIIDKIEGVDIDTPDDFAFAEMVAKSCSNKK